MGSVAVLETLPTWKTLTQQQAIEREFGGPQSKALVTLYKPVYCRFLYRFTGSDFMGLIEKRQFRHQQRECPLHNNNPTVQQSKGTIRKLLLRTMIGCIVVLASLF